MGKAKTETHRFGTEEEAETFQSAIKACNRLRQDALLHPPKQGRFNISIDGVTLALFARKSTSDAYLKGVNFCHEVYKKHGVIPKLDAGHTRGGLAVQTTYEIPEMKISPELRKVLQEVARLGEGGLDDVVLHTVAAWIERAAPQEWGKLGIVRDWSSYVESLPKIAAEFKRLKELHGKSAKVADLLKQDAAPSSELSNGLKLLLPRLEKEYKGDVRRAKQDIEEVLRIIENMESQ